METKRAVTAAATRYDCQKEKSVIYCRYGKDHRAKAASTPPEYRRVFESPPDERKEGEAMYVTYQDLIQIGILLATLADVLYQVYKGKKK